MQTMSEEKTASEGHAEGEAGTRSAELVKRARRQHGIEAVRTIIRFAMDRMRETQLQEVASSMTLTTLLSLVPLIAVAMSAFALFPSFADSRHALEEAIISGVLPQQYTETIVTYLRNFTDHASGLGIFGLAGLAVTALLLIDKFFVTVNRIYQVRRMRPWGQRALLYWALLKTLWRHRREGETSVGITTLADEVDSYPQAARRILLRLAEKGYCVEIMSEKPKSHSDWALLCDPSAKSLRDACTALLVDGTNHLTSPKRASSSRDEGMLFDWYRGFMSAEMLAKPLDEVFTIDEEPQDVQAEQTARPA